MPDKQEKSPVFICGYPKSGTTLLLALMDSHPDLLVFPEETKFFRNIVGRPERCNPNYVLEHTGVRAFGFDQVRWPSGYRDYSAIDFEAYQRCLNQHWANCDKVEPCLLESVISCFGQLTGQAQKLYWVEKTPLNENYLNKAVNWWSDLRAIYIIRDPRDNYCSYQKTRQQRRQASEVRFHEAEKEDHPSDLEKRKPSIPRTLVPDEFIAYWFESLNNWERFAVCHPDKSLLIRYEDLVRFPRQAMERVCSFLRISWDEVLLQPTRNGVFWSGNSMHGTEFKGISTASVGKYKEVLSEREVCYLEAWLRHPILRYEWQLAYQPVSLFGLLRYMPFNRNSKLLIKAMMIAGLVTGLRSS
jgi:hypothetical protein